MGSWEPQWVKYFIRHLWEVEGEKKEYADQETQNPVKGKDRARRTGELRCAGEGE